VAATDVITLAEAKEQLNITSTADDAELAGFISGVSEAVEDYAGAVVQRTVTETFDGGRSTVLLTRTPVASVTSVTDNGTVLDASGYEVSKSGVLTRVAGQGTLPFLPGTQSVEVVYVAGVAASTAAAPWRVKLAAKIILQHLWETQRPAASGLFSQGSDDYDPRYSYSLPRRALELLGEPVGGIA
jgi:uncharacterized phiE125 gp8 family phage protein